MILIYFFCFKFMFFNNFMEKVWDLSSILESFLKLDPCRDPRVASVFAWSESGPKNFPSVLTFRSGILHASSSARKTYFENYEITVSKLSFGIYNKNNPATNCFLNLKIKLIFVILTLFYWSHEFMVNFGLLLRHKQWRHNWRCM